MLRLHAEGHKHFSGAEGHSRYGSFMHQTSRYTKTESVMRRISVDVREQYRRALGCCRKRSREGLNVKAQSVRLC
jgi:hypothetical protein